MKNILITALLTSISFSAAAFESYYVVNPLASKGVLELELTKGTTNSTEPGYMSKREMSASTTALGINYSRRVFETWTVGAGTSFLNRNLSYDTYGQNHSVSGLSDLSLNAKSGRVFETFTLTYGAAANLSPGPSRLPFNEADQRNPAGNNFSGIQSLSPFIGAESYVDEIAVGGRFLLNAYSEQKIEQNNDVNAEAAPAATSYTLEGFAEFPVYKKVDLGVMAGLGRGDLNLGKYFEGSNEYKAQVYTQYRFEKDSTVILGLTAANRILPIEKNSNEISLGFRRSL